MKTSKATTTKAILSDIEKEALNNIMPSLNSDTDIVSEYVNDKQAKKAISLKLKTNLPKVISEITVAISDLKENGYKTKSAYAKALIDYKTSKGAKGELSYEIGLVTYFLNLGLSLNKIENSVSSLHKWRNDKKSLNDILTLIK